MLQCYSLISLLLVIWQGSLLISVALLPLHQCYKLVKNDETAAMFTLELNMVAQSCVSAQTCYFHSQDRR